MYIELLTHVMVLPVTLPLVAGLACLLIPDSGNRLRATVGVLAAASVAAICWQLFRHPGSLFEPYPWLALSVDPLSGFVLLAVACFGLVIAVYSVGYMQGRERHREYFAYLLWTLAASCGAVLANDLLLLLACWGFLGLLLYLMAGIAGPQAAEAARKSLVIIGGSDALLMLGIVLYWGLAGTLRMDGAPLAIDSPAARVAFLAFLAAALAKAGAVPFHTWVPDFGEHADAPVSAFLPAALDKLLGIYLLARCVMHLFETTPGMYTLLLWVGSVTVIAAVMMAMVQHDLKRLLSFHAVSQVGYMVLGIGTGTAIGLAGGLFHMLNHAIYKCALFLCAGVVEREAGSTDLDRLGGLAKRLPITFIACTVAALAISGIPPLNGFASKWMVYQGIISSSAGGGLSWTIWLTVAMLGSALTLASFVKVLHAVFLCKPSPQILAADVRERSHSMLWPPALLAALCIAFGVFAYPLPLRHVIFPVVSAAAPGVWWAGLATTLIILAMLAGLLIYWLTMRAGRLRRSRTWIGGEHMETVYLSAIPAGPDRHVEVTGVDFYDTVEQLPVLKRLYPLARARTFDIYDLVRRGSLHVVAPLQSLHSGLLPTYLRWFVVGLLAVVWVITQKGA